MNAYDDLPSPRSSPLAFVAVLASMMTMNVAIFAAVWSWFAVVAFLLPGFVGSLVGLVWTTAGGLALTVVLVCPRRERPSLYLGCALRVERAIYRAARRAP